MKRRNFNARITLYNLRVWSWEIYWLAPWTVRCCRLASTEAQTSISYSMLLFDIIEALVRNTRSWKENHSAPTLYAARAKSVNFVSTRSFSPIAPTCASRSSSTAMRASLGEAALQDWGYELQHRCCGQVTRLNRPSGRQNALVQQLKDEGFDVKKCKCTISSVLSLAPWSSIMPTSTSSRIVSAQWLKKTLKSLT